MKYALLILVALNLLGCTSSPVESYAKTNEAIRTQPVESSKVYEVTREERLYTQCVGQVSELTNENRRVITVEGSIRAVSGCVGVAKQLK